MPVTSAGTRVIPPTAAQGPPISPTPTNQSGYTFIVQAQEPGGPGFSDDVTLPCKYSSVPEGVNAGTTVSSDLAFTSVPPTVASLSVDHIAPRMRNSFNADGSWNFELVGNKDDPTPAGGGIAIVAKTQTSGVVKDFSHHGPSNPEKSFGDSAPAPR